MTGVETTPPRQRLNFHATVTVSTPVVGEHTRRSSHGPSTAIWASAEITALAVGIVLTGVGWRWGQPHPAIGVAVAVAAVLSMPIRSIASRRRAALRTPTRPGVRSTVSSGSTQPAWAARERPSGDASTDTAVRQDERARIAGEMRDVISRLSLISVYAGSLELDPARSSGDDEVRLIRRTAATALDEMRGILAMLGEADDATATGVVGGREAIKELVARSEAHGVPSRLTWSGDDDATSEPAVHEAVHHVVEEALANVYRHARGATAAVAVAWSPERVSVTVSNSPGDPGRPEGRAADGGSGFADLRRRIDSLGGNLSAEQSPDGAFQLTAVVPRSESVRRPAPRARGGRMMTVLVAVAATVLLLTTGTWYVTTGAEWLNAAGRPTEPDPPDPPGRTAAASAPPEPTAPLTATVDATVSKNETFDDDKCFHRVEFTARIQVPRGPVTVRYAWTRSDTSIDTQQTVDFRGTGPQEMLVRTGWDISAPGTHWQAVKILAPNTTESNQATFKIAC